MVECLVANEVVVGSNPTACSMRDCIEVVPLISNQKRSVRVRCSAPRMSSKKREIRDKFRSSVFKRDRNKCRMCSFNELEKLDAHHITDRKLMPAGGYVPENGISLCPECHIRAEVFHSTGESVLGYSPEDLYTVIGSSYNQAVESSKKLLT